MCGYRGGCVTPLEWNSGRVRNALKSMEMKTNIEVLTLKLTVKLKWALFQYIVMLFLRHNWLKTKLGT